MSEQVLTTLEEKLVKSKDNLKEELNAVRAGRANPALLDRVEVNYYGTPTPLKQLANVSAPDPRTLMVTPFDPKSVGDIEKAILAANIGINPANDGKAVRLSIPQLTEERRKELAKQAKSIGEEAKVAARNLRRKANDDIKKEEKAGELTEDDVKESLDDIQKITDKAIKEIDEIVAGKEKEIMEV
ncbi:MAG: ribosome recycling factor [Anaerovoracaceae bacterium]|nr:ribosome recycling factor [Anaerovoracaceae bacterium]